MANVYVASTESFVGKSAVCATLFDHFQQAGYKTGYMKPVSVAVTHTETGTFDADAEFIRQHFNLAITSEQTAPVLLRRTTIEGVLKGKKEDWASKLQQAYNEASRGTDVMILEGTNNWAEGALVGLSADRVADMLDAPMLLITRYRTTLAVDAILSVKRFVGDRLRGVLLNQIEETRLDFVKSHVVPFLENSGIPVFGLIPQDVGLAGIPVEDLIEGFGGEVINRDAGKGKLIESLMIGAMGADAGLTYFRRRANKAVITGGDRSDLQLAALDTSTNALILTGNIRPSPKVLDRAEQRGVPILLTADDTLTTVDRVEAMFGQGRVHESTKLDRFTKLMEERLDWARFETAFGISK